MKMGERVCFPRKCVVKFNLLPLKWCFEIPECGTLQKCEVMSIISPGVSISGPVLGVMWWFTW